MKKPWNLLLWLIFGALGIWLTARIVLPVGLPFLLGWGIARMAQPLRPKRCPAALSSFLAVTLVFAGLCALLWLLGRVLFSELETLAGKLPTLLDNISEPLQSLYAALLRMAAKLPASVAPAAVEWIEKLFAGSSVILQSLSQWLLGLAASLLTAVPDIVLFVLTALLSSYFFSAEYRTLPKLLKKHLPEAWLQRAKTLLHRLKTALKAYIKSELSLSAVTLGLCALGLLILGQGKVILLSVLIAIIDALPVFGAGTVLVPWGVYTLLRGDTALAVGLLLLYAVVAIARTVLEPRFLGRQIGLHPLLTLLALYAGYQLFGFLGLLLFPVATMLLKQLYDLGFDNTDKIKYNNE